MDGPINSICYDYNVFEFQLKKNKLFKIQLKDQGTNWRNSFRILIQFKPSEVVLGWIDECPICQAYRGLFYELK